MLYEFDPLELDGRDLRQLPLGDRKKQLAGLFGKRRQASTLPTGPHEIWIKVKNPNSPEDSW
jgi:ATP-dependent DNA ligase